MIPRSALSRRNLTLIRRSLLPVSQLSRHTPTAFHLRYVSTAPPSQTPEHPDIDVSMPKPSIKRRKIPKINPSYRSWSPHLPGLPPPVEWKEIFEPQRSGEDGTIRAWLSNVDAQFACLERFGLDVDDGIPKTVIEIYPGESHTYLLCTTSKEGTNH